MHHRSNVMRIPNVNGACLIEAIANGRSDNHGLRRLLSDFRVDGFDIIPFFTGFRGRCRIILFLILMAPTLENPCTADKINLVNK